MTGAAVASSASMEDFHHTKFRLLSDAELDTLPEHHKLQYVRHAMEAISYLNDQVSRLMGYSDGEQNE